MALRRWEGVRIEKTAKQVAEVLKMDANLLSIISGNTLTIDDLSDLITAMGTVVQLKGTWDASTGSFPGSGAALAGWSYIVSGTGTVGGVAFTVGDRLICILDNASTSTYANNWYKADYTDLVQSVAGRTGAVTLTSSDLTDVTAFARTILDDADAATVIATIGALPRNDTTVLVAALGTATSGRRAIVSDANATTFASIVAGGGANVVPVYADGANWRIG